MHLSANRLGVRKLQTLPFPPSTGQSIREQVSSAPAFHRETKRERGFRLKAAPSGRKISSFSPIVVYTSFLPDPPPRV